MFFQLAPGGAGQDVQLICTLSSGSTSVNADLTGGWLKIQVNLAAVSNPGYPAKDVTGSGGTISTFSVNANGSKTSPAVAIINSDFPKVDTGLLKEALAAIFKNYFNAHIHQFTEVFAAVNVNVVANKVNDQWLKPTYTTYACADTGSGQGVFAVLSKTDKDDANGLTQQVDNRILQTLASGANVALALSPEKVLEHMFLPGAVFALQGSKAEDFEIDNDNLWITNKNDVSWGNFVLNGGQVIAPTIKAGNFQTRVNGSNTTIADH